ncbi:uncharacterized protein LOC108030554 [Drosophila biarmipes]|uniref:uncharacterized protein LOC108030554 n=1 Tax=Drosophila biarmipes TaxID=125945 RepID=UPI0007E6B00B|nr:uncharacterized protein LOC108030554 [Drosophila biarmipes]
MFLIILLLVVSVFDGSESGYFGDLFKCNDLLLRCRGTELTAGKYDDIVLQINRNCSQEIGSQWSNITRCELEATKCLVTQMNGMELNCENIADIMHL